MIDVSRDYAGIRRAAREMFEEGFALAGIARTLRLARASDRGAIISRSIPQRKNAQGYFLWLQYLDWLEATIETGAQLRDLLVIEVEGLKILQHERERFRGEHPTCPSCGAMNEKHALACRQCSQAFKE